MPAVSVILPIYNAQPYLAACLESVCGQTLRDIQIICVNDGSTDDSLDTIQAFAARDERIVIVDKPNGGYGHAMNRGLAEATGDFVAIVEPDDFIDPQMYDDLLRFADLGGMPADIVKGSYWEFFDGRDGYANATNAPQLMIGMPNVPYAFNANEDARVLLYHPSIWTAIYRRSWLEETGIRFIEPKGAGWADNPFVFETMTAAKRVVWVPHAYYYYRLTNPYASTYVKDARMPFDRMRDVRELLHRRNASKPVWDAFYRREFNYIFSTIEEYGHAEGDPQILDFIREALADMDADIVHDSEWITGEQKRYYDEFFGFFTKTENAKGAGLGNVPTAEGNTDADGAVDEAAMTPTAPDKASGAEVAPAPNSLAPNSLTLSVIVPFGDDSRTAVEALQSLAALPGDSLEILLANCACTDRTPNICAHFASLDSRIRLFGGAFGSVAEGVNLALSQARGRHVFFADLRHALDAQRVSVIAQHAGQTNADVVVVDEASRFLVEAMKSTDAVSCAVAGELYLSQPFAPQAGASYLFNCCASDRYLAFYKTSFVRNTKLQVSPAETRSACAFTARAIMAAERVAYAGGGICRSLVTKAYPALGPHDPRTKLVSEPAPITPSALEFARELMGDAMPDRVAAPGAMPAEAAGKAENPSIGNAAASGLHLSPAEAFAQSARNMVMEAFACDLDTRASSATMQAFADEFLPQVNEVLGSHFSGVGCHDAAKNLYVQLVQTEGPKAYLSYRYFEKRGDVQWLQNELRELDASATMRLGRMAKKAVTTLVPRNAISKVRGILVKR